MQIKNIFHDSIHMPGQRFLVLMLVNGGKMSYTPCTFRRAKISLPLGLAPRRVYLSSLSIALGQFTISCFGRS